MRTVVSNSIIAYPAVTSTLLIRPAAWQNAAALAAPRLPAASTFTAWPPPGTGSLKPAPERYVVIVTACGANTSWAGWKVTCG
jgi:hypothetical protein